MKKYKVIANPTAGRGAGERAIPQIERLLTQYSLDFDIVCTKRPWHAAELAREAVIAEYAVIVAVGGDGTANEVINGLMEAKQAGTRLRWVFWVSAAAMTLPTLQVFLMTWNLPARRWLRITAG